MKNDVLTQLYRADEFLVLWETLMPSIESPPRSQFVLWAGSYSDDLIIRAINRACAKSKRNAMLAEDVARYASSVMFHESRGHRRHEPPRSNVRAIL